MKTIAPGEFEAEILNKAGPVILIFHASWCPFCRAFTSILKQHEAEFPWPIVAVNVDDTDSYLWDRYSIEVIPTLIIFESGQPVYRVDGTLGAGLGEGDIERLREYARNRADKMG